MANETITNEVKESISSVELKQTSKGVNFTVKIYNKEPQDAKKTAITIFEELKIKYEATDRNGG
ncbi:MAG: hypothetical protein JSW06_06770 [Thermoplasmatales archaeon]|nr:MAG: hypothetical protein JSW06_06770 [Thermoplasmatales archaeon]